MASSSVDHADIEVWGWKEFFEEVDRLLQNCGRFFDCANESYGNYIIERLETCITSLNRVKS